MSKCKIHNVRFYKPHPEAIYCMALHKLQKKLAVSRADASIEIWNLTHSPFIEKTIASVPDNSSIEGLAWCGDSLFSVGLHGFLVEYDLYSLTKKKVVTVTGEEAFCLDVDKENKHIAVGTEQGYLNIFDVYDEDVLFNKFLDKQEGRILCLKYDPSGNFIASGSVDAIRVWNIKTGHALHKMTFGRTEANKATVVWCLHVLQDLTIISGDSRGKLTFWDGNLGAQIESFQSHKADVLTLCVSDDEKSLYCAGTHANIINYVKVNVKGENHKWIKSIERRIHDHDVKSLILFENKLYSSGIDGYLACSYYPPKTLIKHPPILQNPCVILCRDARLIMLRYSKHLEVWSLGKSIDSSKTSGLLQLEVVPKHLLTLQRTVKNDKGKEVKEGIICCSISNDGKWIVYSTDSILRIFHFNYIEGDKPQLSLIDKLPKNWPVSLQAVFTSDSSKLLLAPRTGGLQIYNLIGAESPTFAQSINTQHIFKDTISFLTTSPSGRYLVAADTCSQIVVWKLNNNEWVQHCKLPKYTSSPTTLTISSNSKDLIIIYSDHKLIEYNLKGRCLTKFSKSLDQSHSKSWPNKSFPVRNITFDPRSETIIIMHDDSNIVVVDRNKPLPQPDAKIPKIESTSLSDSSDSFKSAKHAFHAVKKYKHLVHLGWLSENEMVVVEVSPLSIYEQLPPCLKQNIFGTK